MLLRSWRMLVAGLVFLCAVPFAWAAPTEQEIAKAVRQLGDNEFTVREEASKFLWEAGQSAEPALKEALKSVDQEIVRRAGAILEKFKWGIYPDTPEKIVKLVEDYQSSQDESKLAVVTKLLDAGPPGYVVVGKIAAATEDGEARKALWDHVNKETPRIASTLLLGGSHDSLERLLSLGLASDSDQAMRNYAAYLLLRHRIDGKITELKAQGDRSKDKQAAEALAYLYRAKGDLAEARQPARLSGKWELEEDILLAAGDWKGLVKLEEKAARQEQNAPARGFRPACLRLAGDKEAFKKAIDEMCKDAEQPWTCATSLLLNDMPDEAIAFLKERKSFSQAFEILAAQGRFQDAFALADKMPRDNKNEVLKVQLLKARAYYTLGETAKVKETVALLVKQLGDVKDPDRELEVGWTRIISYEFEFGLKDQAFEHLANLLKSWRKNQKGGQPDGTDRWTLNVVFPKQGQLAEFWWAYMRKKHPGDDEGATLKRLREFLETRKAGENFLATLNEAEQEGVKLNGEERDRWLRLIAETSQGVDRADLAQSVLEKAVEKDPSYDSLIKLADLLTAKKQWKEAATRYREAWEKDRTRAVPLWLAGWSLTKAGQEDEGKKLMELAHLLPLANEDQRFELAETLADHDLDDAADAERELVVRLGSLQSVYVTNVLNELSHAAAERKQYQKASVYAQRVVLGALLTDASFGKTEAYLGVPCAVHRNRARALLADGQAGEAVKEIKTALAIWPSDVDLVIDTMPGLEKHAQKKAADEFYARTFDLYEKLCADHPESGWARNSLAWLEVRCNRSLDQAMEHARKAAALEPENAAYLDTLAEVHFQRGDKDKAIEMMKRCIVLNGKERYFQKQLRRFEAGDRSAEVPTP